MTEIAVSESEKTKESEKRVETRVVGRQDEKAKGRGEVILFKALQV